MWNCPVDVKVAPAFFGSTELRGKKIILNLWKLQLILGMKSRIFEKMLELLLAEQWNSAVSEQSSTKVRDQLLQERFSTKRLGSRPLTSEGVLLFY